MYFVLFLDGLVHVCVLLAKKIRTTVFVNMYDISSGFANEVFLLMYRRVELLRMARELDVDPPNAVLGGSFLPFDPTRLGQGDAV